MLNQVHQSKSKHAYPDRMIPAVKWSSITGPIDAITFLSSRKKNRREWCCGLSLPVRRDGSSNLDSR
jgi:hypothetical protein